MSLVILTFHSKLW